MSSSSATSAITQATASIAAMPRSRKSLNVFTDSEVEVMRAMINERKSLSSTMKEMTLSPQAKASSSRPLVLSKFGIRMEIGLPASMVALCTDTLDDQVYVVKAIQAAFSSVAALDATSDVFIENLRMCSKETIVIFNFKRMDTMDQAFDAILSRPAYAPLVIVVCPFSRLIIADQDHFDVYQCLHDPLKKRMR